MRAMSKHRYHKETDLRLNWLIDHALAPFDQAHAAEVQRFKATQNLAGDLDVQSRDPRLWRSATPDEVASVLERFWAAGPAAFEARESLAAQLRAADFAPSDDAPFAGSADDPTHPELILLDWVLLPVGELDLERHRGAFRAMEDSGDEADPAAPIFVEGPMLAEAELCRGSSQGVLPSNPTFWADGPYSYCDYVFRGVSKAAKLVDPPVGYRDVDGDD
jgi:hypothetical protein